MFWQWAVIIGVFAVGCMGIIEATIRTNNAIDIRTENDGLAALGAIAVGFTLISLFLFGLEYLVGVLL